MDNNIDTATLLKYIKDLGKDNTDTSLLIKYIEAVDKYIESVDKKLGIENGIKKKKKEKKKEYNFLYYNERKKKICNACNKEMGYNWYDKHLLTKKHIKNSTL